MPNAGETLRNCDQIKMKQVSAKGDSFISGEYLGWNAKDLTLINCTGVVPAISSAVRKLLICFALKQRKDKYRLVGIWHYAA